MGNRRLVPLLALALVTSCGGNDDPAPPPGGTGTPPDDCPVPNRWASDGQCRAPGEQDDGCPAGTAAQDDGSCLPAGIPPEACLPGFTPSGDRCEPILPPAVCPEGEMAVMGETTCRPVMPCGTGTWGSLPVDGATTYVDQSYGGGDSDGSEQRPWSTITDGVTHAPAGGLVAVAAGSYVEDVSIADKAVRLWGVCPSRVEIVGVSDYAALSLASLNEPAEVGGVAITGAGMGLIAVGTPELLVDRVWIHHTARRGLDAEDALGPTTIIVRGSLIEGATLLGLSVFGTEADVQDTVVRATIPRSSDGELGTGVVAFPGASGARSNLVLRNVLVELNHASGITTSAADVTLEGTVVRDTRSSAAQTHGLGVLATDSPETNEPSVLTIRSSVIERNRSAGVFVSASDAQLEATLVRNTDFEESTQDHGWGIVLESIQAPAPPANLSVRNSVIEDSHTAGIFAYGGDQIDVESTVVRHTMRTVASGLCGRGIDVTASVASPSPATVTLHGSRLEHNVDCNVFFAGADATVSGTLMQNGEQGGLHVQAHEELGMVATLALSGSRVSTNEAVGVSIYGGQVHIESCHIDATRPNASGHFGDGLLVASGEHAASLFLATSLVSNSIRAGLSNFGAFASVGDSALHCQDFDMNGEVYEGQQPTFENRGGNSCGCDGVEVACEAVSAGLSPPPPNTTPPPPTD